MKNVVVRLSQDQFSAILAEAQEGDTIVLTDGERRMILQTGHSDAPAADPDLEEGRPELAAEILLAGKKKLPTYSREDLEAMAEEIRRAKEGGSKDV